MQPWDNLGEPELVALARGGAPEAYGELVRRHQARVYNVVLRMVGERQDALDLSQEVFVRAYGALGGFDLGRPFGPWIAKVAVNLTLSWLQRRRPPALALADDADAPRAGAARPPPDYSAEPERLHLAGEGQARLRAAIAGLPPHYRAVIELRHFQDLPYEQIAAALGIALSDVKSHLFRARRLLRQALEGEP